MFPAVLAATGPSPSPAVAGGTPSGPSKPVQDTSPGVPLTVSNGHNPPPSSGSLPASLGARVGGEAVPRVIDTPVAGAVAHLAGDAQLSEPESAAVPAAAVGEAAEAAVAAVAPTAAAAAAAVAVAAAAAAAVAGFPVAVASEGLVKPTFPTAVQPPPSSEASPGSVRGTSTLSAGLAGKPAAPNPQPHSLTPVPAKLAQSSEPTTPSTKPSHPDTAHDASSSTALNSTSSTSSTALNSTALNSTAKGPPGVESHSVPVEVGDSKSSAVAADGPGVGGGQGDGAVSDSDEYEDEEEISGSLIGSSDTEVLGSADLSSDDEF